MTHQRKLCIVAGCLVALGAVVGGVLRGEEPEAKLWEDAWRTAEPARELLRKGKVPEGRAAIDDIMKKHVSDWRIQAVLAWVLGVSYLREGEYQEALNQADELDRLLADHGPVPESISIVNSPRELRVRTHTQQGRFEKARTEAGALLEDPSKDPWFLTGAMWTAIAYAREGKVQEAERFLRKQVERAPAAKSKGVLLTYLAETKFGSGDKEGALEVLDQVIRDYPEVKERAQTMRQAMSGAAAGCHCGCGAPEAEPKVCAEECCQEDKPAAKQERQEKPQE